MTCYSTNGLLTCSSDSQEPQSHLWDKNEAAVATSREVFREGYPSLWGPAVAQFHDAVTAACARTHRFMWGHSSDIHQQTLSNPSHTSDISSQWRKKITLEQNNSSFLPMWNTQKHLQHHSVLLWTWMEARRSQLMKSCCLTLRLTESHCRIVPSQLQENVCCLGMKVLLVLDPNVIFLLIK